MTDLIQTPPWRPPKHETRRGLWHLARSEAFRRSNLHGGLPVTFEIAGTSLHWPFEYPTTDEWVAEVDSNALKREYGEGE